MSSAKVGQIYNMLLAVHSQLSRVDKQFAWFQDPMKLEDAYGRLWPIPVEHSYLMVKGAIKGKFQTGVGKSLVARNQWVLFDPSNTQKIFSPENWDPVPGMRITMAMILPQMEDKYLCPRLDCPSTIFTDALGGGNNW